MLKKLIPSNLLYSPDAAEGGGSPSQQGTLVESDGSDNSSSALEADGDSSETSDGSSIDFGLFTGETDTPAKPSNAKRMPQKNDQQVEGGQEGNGQPRSTVNRKKFGPLKTSQKAPTEETAEQQDDQQEGDDQSQQQGEEEAEKAKVVEGEDKRDYSKFDPKDVEYLRKLPNTIFKHLSPVLQQKYQTERELKEAKTQVENLLSKNPQFRVPENWYEHEEAYTLTPEWKANSSTFNRATQELQFWEQQLLHIERNEKFQNLRFDPNNGYFGEGAFDPSPENKLAVMRAIQDAQGHLARAEATASNIAQQFKSHHSQAKTHYDDVAGPRFAQLNKDLQPKEDHIKAFLEGVVLPQHRGSSLAQLAAKMFSVVMNQGILLNKLQGNNNAAARNNNDKRAAGAPSKPKSVPSGVGGKDSNGKEIDFDILMDEMQEA